MSSPSHPFAGAAAVRVTPRRLVLVSLLDALLGAPGDADGRRVPALDPTLQAPMRDALAELRAALERGQVERTRRAIAAVRRLAQPPATADGADRAAVGVLVTLAERELASEVAR